MTTFVRTFLLCCVWVLVVAPLYATVPFQLPGVVTNPKHISVIGAGYVGLVVSAGLAALGHQVICADIDAHKINQLQQGQVPIFEQGLQELINSSMRNSRLKFTDDIAHAIQTACIIMVTVGTPMNAEGVVDKSALNAVVQTIGDYLDHDALVCIKSTVPIGINREVQEHFAARLPQVMCDVVSNPEFLREGSALKDFFTRNPIILGGAAQSALDCMHELYESLIACGTPLITTNWETAELIKYAWNGFSATKIAYVNELSHLCNATGADIATVVNGMQYSDTLLPTCALKPGPGFGGSCLPKDTRALVHCAAQCGVDMQLIKTAIKVNQVQPTKIVQQLRDLLEPNAQISKQAVRSVKYQWAQDKTIAILGLSYKAGTDDVRCSPAIPIIQHLLDAGAYVRAYDPQAMERMASVLPHIQYCSSAQEAMRYADAVLVLTEWPEFKTIQPTELVDLLKKLVVVDARNIWSAQSLKNNGIVYANLGRQV